MSAITAPRVNAPASPRTIVDTAIEKLATFLTAHSVAILRVSHCLVFVVFASFKYVVGASPAQDLAIATVDKLTLGMVNGHSALLFTAITETIIGVTLLTGRFVKVGLCVMAMAMVGILSPLVLFPGQMWGDHGPTLTGQYVFKDIVLVAGAMVVAAHALGARLRRD
jgi:putative oxidoreductase